MQLASNQIDFQNMTSPELREFLHSYVDDINQRVEKDQQATNAYLLICASLTAEIGRRMLNRGASPEEIQTFVDKFNKIIGAE